ncbi:hypothetical protein WPG_1202 [Winogradskyella sp. PG-2]|nr:hypothetical protein WPG_1202 [Winogradskyella sp. PG-2]
MIKKITLFFVLTCFTFYVSAQENILSLGSESTSTSGKVSY